jgi:hypothetical protein
MRIRCPNCGAKLHFDQKHGASNAQPGIRCWMCTLTVKVNSSGGEPGPPTIALAKSAPHQRSRDARLGGALSSQTTSLTLPLHKTIKISVIAGSSQGMEYELSRPLVTIGRPGGGADIEIDDPEISRLHCAVEIRRDAILLHDLRSTNGTYLGDSRVFAARLEETSTFRIGSSLLQVLSEPKFKPKTKSQ